MRAPEKQELIVKAFIEEDIDVLVLTETWLRQRLTYKARGLRVAQSPSHKNEGVLILLSAKVKNV